MFEFFPAPGLPIAIFSLVTIAVFAILQMPSIDPYRQSLCNRLRSLCDSSPMEERGIHSPLLQSAPSKASWTNLFDAGTEVRTLLAQAGYYRQAPFAWYCIAGLICMLVIASAGVAIFYCCLPSFLSMRSLIHLGALTIGGWFVPRYWLYRAVEKRHRMLRKSIPDLFELMIVCFDAGLSLAYTLKRVTNELQLAHPQLANELLRVQHDMEMGASIELALNNFAQRSNFDGLKSLCTLVREANRFGSDITQALKDHADLLRLQREMAAEELAQKASVKIIFPILLFILPAVFVVVAGPAFIQLSVAFAKGNP